MLKIYCIIYRALEYQNLGWYDGINLLSAKQLKHLKIFYSAINWWKLTQRFGDATWSSFVDRNQCFLASDEQKTFVVYFSNTVPSNGD